MIEIKDTTNISWVKSDFPKLQMDDFIEVFGIKEMRFFLNDEFEQYDGIIHPDEDHEFKEKDITEVWRCIDCETYKCIYRREEDCE